MDMKKLWVAGAALVLVVGLAIGAAGMVGFRDEIPIAPTPITSVVLPVEEELPPFVDHLPTIGVATNYVQLSSHRTEAEASRAIKVHGIELKGIVSASLLEVYKVVVGTGTWYRVVLPQPSREDAKATCDRVKVAGRDCLVFTF